MNEETYEALKRVIKFVRGKSNELKNNDTIAVESWVDEVSKEYGGDHRTYSVWVGGGEVNDNLLSKEKAEETADYWRREGYKDVKIEEVVVDENTN